MAVTEQQSVQREPEPKPASRPRVPAWPKPSQIQRSLPIYQLLTRIASVPEVRKIVLLIDGSGVYVHVFLPDDNREAEATIYMAEGDYLNATVLHPFELHITPLSRVPESIVAEYALAGYETILER